MGIRRQDDGYEGEKNRGVYFSPRKRGKTWNAVASRQYFYVDKKIKLTYNIVDNFNYPIYLGGEMKRSRIWFIITPLFLVLTSLNAQGITVHEMIGKNMDQVIAKYGKPSHQDRSNPSMECVFYKTKENQIVFVANEGGVFQAEGSNFYDKKSAAENAMDNLISMCVGTGFTSDTLNVAEINLHKKGVDLNVSLFENTYSKKYELKVKAHKTID